MTTRHRGAIVTMIAILVGGASGCSSEPALSDAITLQCPVPGALPFRLTSSGFQNADNSTLATNDPRNKDQASDTIGNPDGITANSYFGDSDAPVSTPIDYRGVKARTTPTGGLVSSPLPGENVSLWTYDADSKDWTMLGRTMTGSDGSYDLPATAFVAANGQPVYAVLEADGSCTVHYDYLYAPGSKFVVFDIDGTLTTDNNELVMELADETYVPKMMTAANTMVQAWVTKGYPIVYLSARIQPFRAETRLWIDSQGFPEGPVITENATEDASIYKTAWLTKMITDFGWVAEAAYGNEDTDVTAYANLNIPLDHTFIIGPQGGDGGTVAIPNMDYTAHIASFIANEPDDN